MTLTAFARLLAGRRAQIAGVYLRKGSLLVGSDSDLVLWNLDGRGSSIPAASSSRRTRGRPSRARKIQARVAPTLVRGQTVYADGQIRVAARFGRFLSGRDDYRLAAAGR